MKTIDIGGNLCYHLTAVFFCRTERGALDGNPDILAVANLAGIEDVDALDGLGFDMGVVVGAADGQHPFGGL